MNILVIHPHLHFFGGSERLTKTLLYELKHMDVDITVITKAKDERWFPDDPSIKFIYIKEKSKDNLPLHLEKIYNIFYTLQEIFYNHSPDVTLVMIQEPIYPILIKIIKPDHKVAMYIHYPIEEEVTEKNLQKFLENYRFPTLYENFYTLSDIHITNSYYTAKALYKLFRVESNVIYPAIDWDFFNENPPEEKDKTILYVGRFVPQKRQDLLIDWFINKIKREEPNSRLVLIGIKDLRYEDYYEYLIQKAEKEKDIEIIDKRLDNKDLIKYYQEAMVYVHPRIGEHFGLTPVEAMTQGAIPIIPKKSGFAELVTHKKEGFLANSDEEFIYYILQVLKMDNKKRKEMISYGRLLSYYFTPSRFAKEIYSILSLLVP